LLGNLAVLRMIRAAEGVSAAAATQGARVQGRSLDMDEARPGVLVRDLVCRFADKIALDGVDLAIAPGEIHALLGPNGAGKTTFIRVLCGLVEPERGTVTTSGRIGFVPSGDRSFYLRLSNLENLIFFARLNGLRLREAARRAREVLDAVGLGDVAKRPVGRCSHGMQKRLSVARALLVRPELLLVDEATHDLDPEGARRIRALVRRAADEGTAVLWTTQRVDEIAGFAHSTTLLVQGRVVFSGSPAQLAARAPSDRYLVQIRASGAGGTPPVEAIRRAAGPGTPITPTHDAGYFLLDCRDPRGIGAVVARLVDGGFDVISARQAQSEIEEAFLVLTGAAA
jgi:ABC-type multidrug transport system ATPase subunit